MLPVHRIEIWRVVFACCVVTTLLISLPAADAQLDPSQQAAAQAQQDAMTAAQAAQQANDQMMRDAQQASQQAMQAQQAAMDTSSKAWPHPGYGRADKPKFSPRPGRFSGPVRVTISAPATPKADIFYTLDGSAPTTASARYTGPVLVASSAKLRAIVRSPIYSPSRVSNGRYLIR